MPYREPCPPPGSPHRPKWWKLAEAILPAGIEAAVLIAVSLGLILATAAAHSPSSSLPKVLTPVSKCYVGCMKIKIDERFEIRTDRTGYEVFQYRPAEKGPKQGQLGWYSEGHYDTLPWALRGAFGLMLHEGQGEATLEQLAARIEEAEASIVRALAKEAIPTKASPWALPPTNGGRK